MNCLFVLLFAYTFAAFYTDLKRTQCSSCCRVQILSLYNPISKNHEYNYLDDNEIYWVMDFQFDNQDLVQQQGPELEFRVRPLDVREDTTFTRQSFEFRPYQMISMFHNTKWVMDFCAGMSINTVLIPWGKKDEKLNTTNNQRFLYIYDNKGYTGRGSLYRKSMFVPYSKINNKAMCFTVGSERSSSKPCLIVHTGNGTNDCKVPSNAERVDNFRYYAKDDNYVDWGYEIKAHYCFGQNENDETNSYIKKRQQWLPIYW